MIKCIADMSMMPSFHMRGAITMAEIDNAEDQLHLRFASEYRNYLLSFGTVSVHGHELTGICSADRLNVVQVTQKQKRYNIMIPENFYVIEETNIDGIVIWQNSAGEIFQTSPDQTPIKVYDSLCEYISA